MHKLITSLIILMGLSCFSGQVLFIREFLIIFYGNELTIGLILANWLILEALGSFIFGHISSKTQRPVSLYVRLQVIAGLLFPLSIFGVRLLKTLLNIGSGEGLSLSSVFLWSLLIMLPLGTILGGQFPLVCRLYKDFRQKSLATAVGKSYFLEAIGFGLGGIMVTYFFIPHFNSMRIAFLLGWSNIIAATSLAGLTRKKNTRVLSFLILFVIGLWLFNSKVDIWHELSLKWQWKKLNLVDYQNSVYGNIAVTKQAEQYVFFYNGLPLLSIPTPDLVFNEDIVNFSLGAKKTPKEILMVGTGLGGIISNILKFPVKKIDYAELDPLIVKMANRYQTDLTTKELSDLRLAIHNIDGRLFLRKTPTKYDVIVMNMPSPSTLQLNRFFTQEFFQLAADHLKKDGLFCFTLPGSLSYLSAEQIDLNKCILESLNAVFAATEVIVGHNNIYLASPKKEFKISPDLIINNLKTNRIQTHLFTESYIRDRLRPHYQQWFYKNLKTRNVRRNRDLVPIGVFYSLSFWNTLFTPGFNRIFKLAGQLNIHMYLSLIAMFVFFFFIMITLARLKAKKQNTALPQGGPLGLLVFISGFSGVSLNLILLLSLQIFYGYVYLHLGLLVSGFMVGLTLGGFLMTNKLSRKNKEFMLLVKIDFLFVLFCLFFYFIFSLMSYFYQQDKFYPFLLAVLFILSGASGFFVGYEFPLANKIYLERNIIGKSPANVLYAVDMLGAFCGSLIISILMLPVIGVINTVIWIFCLKLGMFTLLATSFFFAAKKYP